MEDMNMTEVKNLIVLNRIITWAEFHARMKERFGKSFRYVDELYFNVEKRISFGECRILDDSEVLGYLQDLHSIRGEVCVITDLCYDKEYGTFIIDSNDLERFINTFYSVFGEVFYSTDVIIVNFEEKIIWVLFHEGIGWLSRG